MAHSTATLAKGCFGKVYKEKYKDQWAAVKRVPVGLVSRKDLERECEVYKKTTHPNIVKLLGPVTLVGGKYVIPLEFIFGEDLETTIFNVSKSKIPLTPTAKSTIIMGMCEGLLHLHLRDIVHQDLKPDNIMVEHSTNRAVIIDLGLAKFFKHGLNSAVDMGNEAYSAPEVLQRGAQRDQRSDVWAMGKIMAELCARVRLVTTTVCPDKIRAALKDHAFCPAVCRMVEEDPTFRASMASIISEIRSIGNANPKPADPKPAETGRLKPPENTARNRSPSPNRAGSPFNKEPSPNRAGSPFNRAPSPQAPALREPSPLNRAPSPYNELLHRSPSPLHFERTPRPEIKPIRHSPHLIPSPPKPQVTDVVPRAPVVPKGGANLTPDLMKLRLQEEVAREVPCPLPATGRVVVRRFQEQDGEVGTWEQREVVTRDGKIVQYNDVRVNSK